MPATVAEIEALVADPEVARACADYRDATLRLQAVVARGSVIEDAWERGVDDGGEIARLSDEGKSLSSVLGDKARAIDVLVGLERGRDLRRRDLTKLNLDAAKAPEKEEEMASKNVGCLLPECSRKTLGRGLCATHYSRATRLIKLGEATWEDLDTAEKCSARIADAVGPRVVREGEKKPRTPRKPKAEKPALEIAADDPAGNESGGGAEAPAPAREWTASMPRDREQLLRFFADVAVETIRRLVLR